MDYERGLNAAVARLRQVLNDSAETPRYIETVARRGYRFVAPVEAGSDTDSRGSSRPPVPLGATVSAVLGNLRNSDGSIAAKWLVAGLFIAVAMLLVIVQQVRRPPPLPRIAGYSQITHRSRAKAYGAHRIVADASRVYFTETNGPARSALHQVAQSGGETSLVPTGLQENVEIGDISPDGSLLLLQTFASPEPEMRLWTLHVSGGAPRRLGDLRGRDPAWSPDGQSISYAKGDELYICKADGTENRRVVSGPGPVTSPRWAPDGRALRYTRGGTRIEEIPASGGNPRLLLPGWKGAHCCGNWTTDGRYYFFESTELGRRVDIWVIREKHGLFRRVPKPTRLTAGPIDFQSAAPGKDGTRLFAIGSQPRGELVRYDARKRQFVPHLEGLSVIDVEATRDGRWLAYVGYPDGVLWRSKADGSERLQLTTPSMVTSVPRWSPDGERIAFSGRTGREPWAIYQVSREGEKLERVNPEQLNQGDPSWSPDGLLLAFGRLPWLEGGSSGPPTIQVLNLKTRQVSALPGSEGLYSPHWSPDGRYMLALKAAGQEMSLFDLNKRTWQVVDIPATYPNWSRDGRHVHFINPRVAVPALYRLRVSDGSVQRIFSMDFQQLGWTIVGKWSGLASDDSPLVLRDAGIQEIFSLDCELP